MEKENQKGEFQVIKGYFPFWGQSMFMEQIVLSALSNV